MPTENKLPLKQQHAGHVNQAIRISVKKRTGSRS